MKDKLYEVPTLLGTRIYAYDITRGINNMKEYEIVHCDDEMKETVLSYLNYKIIKERSEGIILQKEINRVADIFDEGMKFGQKILKQGFKS